MKFYIHVLVRGECYLIDVFGYYIIGKFGTRFRYGLRLRRLHKEMTPHRWPRCRGARWSFILSLPLTLPCWSSHLALILIPRSLLRNTSLALAEWILPSWCVLINAIRVQSSRMTNTQSKRKGCKHIGWQSWWKGAWPWVEFFWIIGFWGLKHLLKLLFIMEVKLHIRFSTTPFSNYPMIIDFA